MRAIELACVFFIPGRRIFYNTMNSKGILFYLL